MRIAIYDPRLSRSAIGSLGTSLQVALALTTSGYAVDILHEGELTKAQLFAQLGFEIPQVTLRAVTPSEVGLMGLTDFYDIFINATPDRFIRSRCKNSVWFCAFPPRPHLSGNLLQAMKSYRHLVACSDFAQRWFKLSWQRETTVIHPLIRPIVPDYPKKQVIVSVGDFAAGRNNKKQGVLMTSFCELLDEGFLEGWELHLVGTLRLDNDADRDYFNKLDLLVGDYPIFLHPNPKPEEALSVVNRAAIYWHAAGYEENVEKHPNWIEPFNVGLVEAMSAGCVPLVIKNGSHIEIVDEAKTGMMWSDIADLERETVRLSEQVYPRELLSKAALENSQPFCDLNRFTQKLLAVLGIPALDAPKPAPAQEPSAETTVEETVPANTSTALAEINKPARTRVIEGDVIETTQKMDKLDSA